MGEAENGLKAVEKYQELRPDLTTMDITMPEMDNRSAKVIKLLWQKGGVAKQAV